MTTIEKPRKCEIINCRREAIRQFLIVPGTSTWLCDTHYGEFEEDAPEFNERAIGDESWDR